MQEKIEVIECKIGWKAIGEVVNLKLTDSDGVEIMSASNGVLSRQYVDAGKRFISLADLPDNRGSGPSGR